jgi:ribosome-associated heat shock protein Hsp15
MRLDLLLVRLRFAKSRSIAQKWISEGHFRLNGARIDKADAAIAAGAVLTMPVAAGARVIVIEALPDRRGPPAEARSCYRDLDAAQRSP